MIKVGYALIDVSKIGVPMSKIEQVSHIVLVFLLLTLNK